jgi:hypothetical protein
MSTQAERLTAWADELESGRWRQDPYVFFGMDGKSACVRGVGLAAVKGWKPRHTILEVLAGPRGRWDSSAFWQAFPDAVMKQIATEACRLSGKFYHGQSLDWLNADGVTFPIFAQAIRHVVRQMEEQSYGEPIVVEEREVVNV